MWEIAGTVQHYAWGSRDVLPTFLGRPADGTPWAEAWFGAHPVAPSLARVAVRDGTPAQADAAGTAGHLPLDTLISQDVHRTLGDAVLRAFGDQLPFLLKVIAPAAPLSLQVHPSRDLAAESFAAENAAGLATDSPRRNYKDANHKPEMLVALTRFEALCGFRTPRRAAAILEGLGTGLTERLHRLLLDQPHANGMRAAFRTLITPSLRPEPWVVEKVAEACGRRLEAGNSPSPRIDATVFRLQQHFPGDPGVVAAILLNPVTLYPGEAMYVPAGTIHAYLSGTGIEIMAASDNVLRAGLTAKKVDAEEMLRCVSVQAGPPIRVAPERLSAQTVAYYAPVDDFELSVTTLGEDGGPGRIPVGTGLRRVQEAGDVSGSAARVPGSGPRILLGLEGRMEVLAGYSRAWLRPGSALFVPADAGAIQVTGQGQFAQACVP
jgi:mannose-6-phosphate isomerase